MPETFGAYLRALRKEKGLTQRQLAIALQIDFSYISKLEGNKTEYPPASWLIEQIAEFFQADRVLLYLLANKLPPEIEAEIVQAEIDRMKRERGL